LADNAPLNNIFSETTSFRLFLTGVISLFSLKSLYAQILLYFKWELHGISLSKDETMWGGEDLFLY
jgi:hypothetical protein